MFRQVLDRFVHAIVVDVVARGLASLDSELREKLHLILEYLGDVRDVRVSRQMFRSVQIHRNNSFYNFLMSICELIFASTIPSEEGEGYSKSFVRNAAASSACVLAVGLQHKSGAMMNRT
jgi:hypothetical protein